MSVKENYIKKNFFLMGLSFIYLKNTQITKNVTKIPIELNAIAPIAIGDSNFKKTSGIFRQNSFDEFGRVPARHVIHCVSSSGFLIC